MPAAMPGAASPSARTPTTQPAQYESPGLPWLVFRARPVEPNADDDVARSSPRSCASGRLPRGYFHVIEPTADVIGDPPVHPKLQAGERDEQHEGDESHSALKPPHRGHVGVLLRARL